MKTNTLSLLALTGALFLMTACANEETNSKQEQAQKPDTKGLTAFVVNNGATRTTADYDGSGLNFYWTEGDRLWVNNGTLIQDNSNNITDLLTPNPKRSDAVKRAATARFYFSGTYTAPSYPVRYTGKNSTVGDKVTIKSQQAQDLPNDAAHIGEDGDCGTGTAINSGGGYNFALDHKASYLTLLPYSTINFSTAVKLTQVKITADEALSGQFNFDDSGIDLGSRPTPTTTNRSITLTLSGGGTNGFVIPVAAAKETNSPIMVLPPGTYNNVSIEYTLYDQFTTKTETIKKEYATLTFVPGKNKKISTNLQMRSYITPMGYWREFVGPNTNQALWYIHRGDPHLDQTTIFAAKRSATSPANICLGGVWVKKAAKIPGFTGSTDHTGTNQIYYKEAYRLEGFSGYTTNVGNHAISLPSGIPANISDYYFIPSVFGSQVADGVSIKSGDGALRYWMGTRFYGHNVQGNVFAVDVPPAVPSANIGIGCNYNNNILAYWQAQ